jgi:hypothetical protein
VAARPAATRCKQQTRQAIDRSSDVEIALSVRDWTFIDATIDNTVAIAAQGGELPIASYGFVLREAGWEAVRNDSKSPQGTSGWPPEDEELTLDLPVEAWKFIADQLRRWDGADALARPRQQGGPESRFQQLARVLEERLPLA